MSALTRLFKKSFASPKADKTVSDEDLVQGMMDYNGAVTCMVFSDNTTLTLRHKATANTNAVVLNADMVRRMG